MLKEASVMHVYACMCACMCINVFVHAYASVFWFMNVCQRAYVFDK
jgi:hypothetical protein